MTGIARRPPSSPRGMTVYVVMGNDYPDAVFSSERDAHEYINTKKKIDKHYGDAPKIYWRVYGFTLR